MTFKLQTFHQRCGAQLRSPRNRNDERRAGGQVNNDDDVLENKKKKEVHLQMNERQDDCLYLVFRVFVGACSKEQLYHVSSVAFGGLE